MAEILITGIEIPKDKPVGVVIHPSGRVEVPDSFEASFSYPRVVGVNLLRAHEITDHGDLVEKTELSKALLIENGKGEKFFAIKVEDYNKMQVIIPASKE